MIDMSATPLHWDLFKQSHQNALDAGYTHVHMSIRSYLLPLQPESLPDNFSGRVWIIPYLYPSYHELVSLVEGVASQGYQVGVIGSSYLIKGFDDYVPSVISSLPLAFGESDPFEAPFVGWNCSSMLMGDFAVHCTSVVTSLTINEQCV